MSYDRREFLLTGSGVTLVACVPSAVFADDFTSFIDFVRQKASERGVSQDVLNSALAGLQVNEKVIQLDNRQPEGRITFPEYRSKIVSDYRISQGRKKLKQHNKLLDQVSREFGVSKFIILALWGIETGYGSFTGGFDIIESLATLAFDGRRRSFFLAQLIDALVILDQGHVERSAFKGSWAGAMGQCQFMPSSFLESAVDYNGDGRRDIWSSHEDIFASMANYLSKAGWEEPLHWGIELHKNQLKDDKLALKEYRDISEWHRDDYWVGDAPKSEQIGAVAKLVAPDNDRANLFLVGKNFDVIMKWNRSTYFAASVGLLADALSV